MRWSRSIAVRVVVAAEERAGSGLWSDETASRHITDVPRQAADHRASNTWNRDLNLSKLLPRVVAFFQAGHT